MHLKSFSSPLTSTTSVFVILQNFSTLQALQLWWRWKQGHTPGRFGKKLLFYWILECSRMYFCKMPSVTNKVCQPTGAQCVSETLSHLKTVGKLMKVCWNNWLQWDWSHTWLSTGQRSLSTETLRHLPVSRCKLCWQLQRRYNPQFSVVRVIAGHRHWVCDWVSLKMDKH